jgi:hypothetical protein
MRRDYYTIASRAIGLRLQRMHAVVLRLYYSVANENSEGLAAPEGYSVSTRMRMRCERRHVFRTGSRATRVQRRASVHVSTLSPLGTSVPEGYVSTLASAAAT